jgi:hypothetical protein
MDKYSIVLVIKEYTHHAGVAHNNLERFMKIGMKTYEKYLNWNGVQDFFVVVPRPDVESVKTKLESGFLNVPWKVIAEDVLVSKKVPEGWAKQQTAKLAIASLVKTRHYLIIDDDTYLTKPFGVEDLLWNGKAIMNKCQIDFPFFFLWSAQCVDVDFDEVQGAPFHMAITPEIFVTDVVKDLVAYLEGKYGGRMQWQESLAANKFTEYCMYWTYLRKVGKHEALYACESEAPAVYGYPTSGPEHDLKAQVKRSFEENSGYHFSFVQSSLPFSTEQVAQEVLRYL